MDSKSRIEPQVPKGDIKEEPMDFEYQLIGDSQDIKVENTKIESMPETSNEMNRDVGHKSRRLQLNNMDKETSDYEDKISLLKPCYIVLNRIEVPPQSGVHNESQPKTESVQSKSESPNSKKEISQNNTSPNIRSSGRKRTKIASYQLASDSPLEFLHEALFDIRNNKLSIERASRYYGLSVSVLRAKSQFPCKRYTDKFAELSKLLMPIAEKKVRNSNVTIDSENSIEDKGNDTSNSKNSNEAQRNITTNSKNSNADKVNITTNSKNSNEAQRNITTNSKNSNENQRNITTNSKNSNADKGNVTTNSKNSNEAQRNVTTNSKNSNADKGNVTSNSKNSNEAQRNVTTNSKNSNADKGKAKIDNDNKLHKKPTNQHIPEFVETELVNHCKKIIECGLPLNQKYIIDVIGKIMESEKFKHLIKPFKNGKPSRAWSREFFKRHPEIRPATRKLFDKKADTTDPKNSVDEMEPMMETEMNKAKNSVKNQPSVKEAERPATLKKRNSSNTHTENILYKCNKCSFTAITSVNLNIHIKTVHSNIVYYCDVCGHTTTARSHMFAHMIQEHNL